MAVVAGSGTEAAAGMEASSGLCAPTPDDDEVDLRQLLSGCVSLCRSAMAVIREVQREREAGVALESTMKDPTDSRTYLTKADTLSQRVIVGGLRAKWPNVAVVGEEEESGAEVGESTAEKGSIISILLFLVRLACLVGFFFSTYTTFKFWFHLCNKPRINFFSLKRTGNRKN